jgi:hypothetical protein
MGPVRGEATLEIAGQAGLQLGDELVLVEGARARPVVEARGAAQAELRRPPGKRLGE